jgi:hypothetical protein
VELVSWGLERTRTTDMSSGGLDGTWGRRDSWGLEGPRARVTPEGHMIRRTRDASSQLSRAQGPSNEFVGPPRSVTWNDCQGIRGVYMGP